MANRRIGLFEAVPTGVEFELRRMIREEVTAALDEWKGASGPPLTLNVTEAAEQLRTSKETIRRMILDGVLPTVPGIRGRNVIPRKALEDYVMDSLTNRKDLPTPNG